MHRSRNQNREEFHLSGERIDDMLRSVKLILSAKQYRELLKSVNETDGYAEKKHLIYASIQAKTRKENQSCQS